MFRMLRLNPPHGWNAVAWELGIVTLGVLIALAAQQWAESLNWKSKVAEGSDLLADEAFDNVGTSIEFYAAAPCMLAQVDRARRNLALPATARPPYTLYSDEFGRFAVRTPLRPLYESTWNSLLADGTMAHMGRQQFSKYARLFETARKLSETAIVVDDRAQGLLVLARSGMFDMATTMRLSETAERLAQSISFGRMVAVRNIQAYVALGLSIDEERLKNQLEAQSPTLTACRRANLPIADWRKAFDEQVSPITIGRS